MSYENYSLYSETDPGDNISSDGSQMNCTNIPRNVSAFTYKFYGVDFFDKNLMHTLRAKILSANNNGAVGVWAINNTGGTKADMDAEGDALMVYLHGGYGNGFIYLKTSRFGGEDVYYSFGVGVERILEINRAGGDVPLLRVYATDGTLLDTLSVYHGGRSYDNLQGFFSIDDTNSDVISAYIKSLDIGMGGAKVPFQLFVCNQVVGAF